MSQAGVAGAPVHCSGAMYRGVPDTTVSAPSPTGVAMPKSASLLSPAPSTSTFSGL